MTHLRLYDVNGRLGDHRNTSAPNFRAIATFTFEL
jgi:hypothetical protein